MREDLKTFWWAGLLALLTISFAALRLLGVVGWPWLWVLSPLWVPAGLMVLLLAIAFAAGAVVISLKGKGRRRERCWALLPLCKGYRE